MILLKPSSSTAASFVLLISLTITHIVAIFGFLSSAEAARLHHHHHQNNKLLLNDSTCFPGANFENKQFICGTLLNQTKCGFDQPFACLFPDSSTSFICLSEEELENGNYQCAQGCFDFRACGTPECDRICTQQQCDEAFSIGRVCPNPLDKNFDAREHFICTGGQLENFCGFNNDPTNDPSGLCDNGYECLVNNPYCSSCCDFNSCLKYESCFDVNCSTDTCYKFLTEFTCPPELPFYCEAGLAKHQCSSNATYFPQTGCPGCCDLMNCFQDHHCDICPAEMCPTSSSPSSSNNNNISSSSRKIKLIKKNIADAEEKTKKEKYSHGCCCWWCWWR